MKIVPISKEEHHDWSYVGLSNYNHSIKDSIVPILIAEIGKIAVTNPIVFLEKDKSLGLYSLQSILPEMNLMIDKKEGGSTPTYLQDIDHCLLFWLTILMVNPKMKNIMFY